MSKIPITQMPMARTLLRFARIDSFPRHKWDQAGEHCTICGASDWMSGECQKQRPHWPIQWHEPDHAVEAFRLYNDYSGFPFEPEPNQEGADERVFNWLLEQVLADLVPSETDGAPNIVITISDN